MASSVCETPASVGLAPRHVAKGLRREGWQINDKKVRRLWRDEGLRVPQKRRKKRLTGVGTRVGAMSLIAPNALWAMDFQFDTTADGRTIKMLNIIDEFTREALATETHRSIDADHVVAVLDRLCVERGTAPGARYARVDISSRDRDSGAGFLYSSTADGMLLWNLNEDGSAFMTAYDIQKQLGNGYFYINGAPTATTQSASSWGVCPGINR